MVRFWLEEDTVRVRRGNMGEICNSFPSDVSVNSSEFSGRSVHAVFYTIYCRKTIQVLNMSGSTNGCLNLG